VCKDDHREEMSGRIGPIGLDVADAFHVLDIGPPGVQLNLEACDGGLRMADCPRSLRI